MKSNKMAVFWGFWVDRTSENDTMVIVIG